MNWHRYAPEIMESEGGLFRIYRKRLTDNKGTRYTLYRLHEGAMTRLGEFETFNHAKQAAEDYVDDNVPEGYWDRLEKALRRAPTLPDEDTENDPEPLI